MKTYAILKNFVVINILVLDEESLQEEIKRNEMILEVTDLSPQPQIGWVLNGNRLEFPISDSDREKMEIELNKKKRLFGTELSNYAIDRIGARNKILNKNGTQVTALLTQLIGVKALLETGALGTARFSCVQLKAIFTEYADIFDYVVSEINVFESTFGL